MSIAPALVPIIREHAAGRDIWEPFCGGLGVTSLLQPAVASDAHPALIAMHRAFQRGWVPPAVVTREDHERARLLPDSDPLKGFVGFGCSFSGLYFGVYVTEEQSAGMAPFWESSARVMRETARRCRDVWFAHMSFLDQTPEPLGIAIYADPPYAGTSGYKGTAPFDHERFWLLCQWWAAVGVPVLVSEYTCPVPHVLLLQLDRDSSMANANPEKEGYQRVREERLFRVLAPGQRPDPAWKQWRVNHRQMGFAF